MTLIEITMRYVFTTFTWALKITHELRVILIAKQVLMRDP